MAKQEWRKFTVTFTGRVCNAPDEFDENKFVPLKVKELEQTLRDSFKKLDPEWGVEIQNESFKVHPESD